MYKGTLPQKENIVIQALQMQTENESSWRPMFNGVVDEFQSESLKSKTNPIDSFARMVVARVVEGCAISPGSCLFI